jgi:hypothetical protein
MPKGISNDVHISRAGGGFVFVTGAPRNPEIENLKDAAMDKSWHTIRPMVEKAVKDKMHQLGVPSEEEHRTTLNHFKNNSIAVSRCYFDMFMQSYMDKLFADSKLKVSYNRALIENSEIIAGNYAGIRELVATYGHLESAHTDDGKLASQIISDFTNRNSAPLEQLDILHLDIDKDSGPGHEDLTKLKLEEEFLKTIELEGLKVAMAYLKREYGMHVDIDPAQFTDLPTRPDDPSPPKAKRKVG